MSKLAQDRTAFLDRIRVILTALVILHHSAIMFGAPGGWYLRMPTNLLAEKLPFTLFVSVNQSFFMGFFFLLAGYFSAQSYDRKGARQFIKDRLLRLGVPILAFGYILGPLTIALAAIHEGKPFPGSWLTLMRIGEFSIGPLWFAFALLLFSAAYLLWRQVDRPTPSRPGFTPGNRTLLIAALITGAGAFFLRLWMPVGKELWSLQLGYFSSYIVLFAGGCAVARSRWLENVNTNIASNWRRITWITVPLLFLYGALAGALKGGPFDTSGGWSLPALAYAFWEPFVAWGIILRMLWRHRTKTQVSPRWRAWAPRAYAAYIIHPPIVVGLGLLLANLPLLNSVKFLVAGSCSVALSFFVAGLILKIPGTKKIL